MLACGVDRDSPRRNRTKRRRTDARPPPSALSRIRPPTDPADVPTDLQELACRSKVVTAGLDSRLDASRPAAGFVRHAISLARNAPSPSRTTRPRGRRYRGTIGGRRPPGQRTRRAPRLSARAIAGRRLLVRLFVVPSSFGADRNGWPFRVARSTSAARDFGGQKWFIVGSRLRRRALPMPTIGRQQFQAAGSAASIRRRCEPERAGRKLWPAATVCPFRQWLA